MSSEQGTEQPWLVEGAHVYAFTDRAVAVMTVERVTETTVTVSGHSFDREALLQTSGSSMLMRLAPLTDEHLTSRYRAQVKQYRATLVLDAALKFERNPTTDTVETLEAKIARWKSNES